MPFFSEGAKHALAKCAGLCRDVAALSSPPSPSAAAAGIKAAALAAAEAKLFAVCNPIDEDGMHRLFAACYGGASGGSARLGQCYAIVQNCMALIPQQIIKPSPWFPCPCDNSSLLQSCCMGRGAVVHPLVPLLGVW